MLGSSKFFSNSVQSLERFFSHLIIQIYITSVSTCLQYSTQCSFRPPPISDLPIVNSSMQAQNYLKVTVAPPQSRSRHIPIFLLTLSGVYLTQRKSSQAVQDDFRPWEQLSNDDLELEREDRFSSLSLFRWKILGDLYISLEVPVESNSQNLQHQPQ